MKKIFFLFSAVVASSFSFAQTVPGGDMENWRTSSSGTSTPIAIQAPYFWNGSDSVVIGLGESFGGILMVPDSAWQRQLFEESDAAYVHSGSHSAKVMTRVQDAFTVPGILSTGITHVGVSFFPPGITSITFSGGSAVTVKPTTVSAWVQYYPGKDSTGAIGTDSAVLNVQALSHIGSKDSVIGSGAITIGPDSSWVQVTVTLNYPLDSTDAIDTMRITFASSSSTSGLDSSTLYVDDVTMTSEPNPIPVDHTGIAGVAMNNDVVKVYPNPVTGTLYFETRTAELKAEVYSVSGQVVITSPLTGHDALDVSGLPAGLYFYQVADGSGNTVQRGKVAVIR